MGLNDYLGQSGTFIYSPDISVAVSTIDNGIIDISNDIINFTLDREINQVSTFTATLNNPGRKYVLQNQNGNRLISTMDRITVFLKRTNWVQCFTGYITYAPLLTLQPVPVTITANCTLRILQVTYWDDTLIAYQQLLLNATDQAAVGSAATVTDGGVGQAVVNVLYKVCGWNPNAIHIQSLPPNFISFAAETYIQQLSSGDLDQNAIAELSQILSVKGISSGNSVQTGGYAYGSTETLNNSKAPTGTSVTASKAVPFITSPIAGGKQNHPGPNTLNPVNQKLIEEDIYYCSAPWSYLQYQITPSLTPSGRQSYQKIQDQAKSWLADNWSTGNNDGRLLVVYNQKTDNAVAVRATSIPQVPNTSANGYAVYDDKADYFQLHPSVVAYLNGTVSEPSKWNRTDDPGASYVSFSWADMNKINTAGVIPSPSTTVLSGIAGVANPNIGDSSDPLVITGVLQTLVSNLLGQVGDKYTENTAPKLGYTRDNPGKPGTGTGSFDCSGLAWWGYSTIGIHLGGTKHAGTTWSECGPVDGSQADKYGAWTPNTQQPALGDLVFWEVTGDSGSAPQHVSILITNFGDPGPQGTHFAGTRGDPDVAYLIEASHGGSSSADQNPSYGDPVYYNSNNLGPNVQQIRWSSIANGKWLPWGMRVIGYRSPITLHPSWTSAQLQQLSITSSSLDNIQAVGTSTGTNPSTTAPGQSNPNNPSNPTGTASSSTLNPTVGTASGTQQQRVSSTFAGAYSNLMQPPQFDVRASMLAGTPRAFLLDKPVMNDISQIMGAGLRSYQSAPNGDFVAWFPDYYGVYGTDPVMEISPVEILDFQIYHDDNQLTTHVGVVGDTNGIGSQVSSADYLNTNGIVSIQDGTTAQMLFGKQSPNSKAKGKAKKNDKNGAMNNLSALSFLGKYGMRPLVQEQQMIHSTTLEYMYALYTFMNQWGNQFASNVTFTFMPELYPGMRISITMPNGTNVPDQYNFYVTAVTHTGDFTGGFTTQATLTAPMANGNIMHYGLDLA